MVAFAGYYIGGLWPSSPSRTVTASERSIAVLPFVNFSDAGDTEYFADGLTEELINGLAQLPDLKVAGRTSSFYFKGRNQDLREIGRALGVSHVLEGSVRRSADNLRITAQLIKVSDGFHLWSQTFDNRLDDAFVIQSQIARAVADHLQATLLLEDEQSPGPEARDPKAYQLELVARSRLRKQERRELEIARTLYMELIELEPENATAHAGLAEATITLAQSHLALDFDAAREESESAIETALRLAPDSSEAWRVRGLIDRVLAIRSGQQRYADSALAALQRAVDLDPRNADALALLSTQLLVRGQNEQAIAVIRRSLEIDPLSRLAQQLLGTALDRQGRFGEAQRQYATLIDLYPDFTNAKVALGTSLMEQGKLDEAISVLLSAEALRMVDQAERADRMVEDLLKRLETAPGEYVPNEVLWNRTLALGALGRTEESLDALELAMDQGFRTLIDFEYFLGLEDYPFTRGIAQDPRYAALASRVEEEHRRMREKLLASRR